jgi:putative DNA primase/helicase
MTDSNVGGISTDMPPIDDGEAMTESRGGSNAPRSRRAKLVRAGDVKYEKVNWLWPGRIPAGMLTVVGGKPGLGKSLLTAELAARVTQGGLGSRPADVLFLSAEDSIVHTIVPRLQAAGADLDRVAFPTIERQGFETPLLLPTDVGVLQEFVLAGEVGLVVIDPLMAHLDGANSWKDQEIREALAPLHKLAESTGAAVVLVAHLNKGQSTDPVQRLGGSIGLPAAARSMLLLAADPDDPDGDDGSSRVLAHVKSNISELAPSLLLRIDPVTLEEVETAAIREVGFSRYSGGQLLVPDREPRGSRLTQAMEFLQAQLAGGERTVDEVDTLAADAGITESTLRRARRALDVQSRKLDFDAGWVCSLPAANAHDAEAGQE